MEIERLSSKKKELAEKNTSQQKLISGLQSRIDTVQKVSLPASIYNEADDVITGQCTDTRFRVRNWYYRTIKSNCAFAKIANTSLRVIFLCTHSVGNAQRLFSLFIIFSIFSCLFSHTFKKVLMKFCGQGKIISKDYNKYKKC